jgi:hypothetical protein
LQDITLNKFLTIDLYFDDVTLTQRIEKMPYLTEKILILLKEFILETQMEKLAEDPKTLEIAYSLLIKMGGLTASYLSRKFKLNHLAADKIIQHFRDEGIIDRNGKLVPHQR